MYFVKLEIVLFTLVVLVLENIVLIRVNSQGFSIHSMNSTNC